MTKKITAAGQERTLFVSPDVVDLRDRYYRPALMALPQKQVPDVGELHILDQGRSSACTGFALASVINRQCRDLFNGSGHGPVSPRMLFQMARLHDDLPDEDHAGSTLRGALKGFFHNGVVSEAAAPFNVVTASQPFALSLELAEQARELSLGAYYRLNHEINDYHTALNEAEAIIVSARIHSGWTKPKDGEIRLSTREEGRHAFAIVGYDKEGFLVQNSWGRRWSTFEGLGGVARWRYEDWFENVEDAWVMRLAISSPNAFRVKYARNHRAFRDQGAAAAPFVARRQDVMGHFLHIDDGKIINRGRYAQEATDIDALVTHLGEQARSRKRDVDHILFVAHGALQRAEHVAARTKAWRDVFRANRIYPIHLMWETGFNNQVVDVIKDLLLKTGQRMNKGDQFIDDRLEELARPLGRKLWRDLKITAELSVAHNQPAGQAIERIVDAAGPLKLHFLSQSAGALLFSACLNLFRQTSQKLETATLMAPACSLEHYEDRMKPHLGSTVKRLVQYSLIEAREKSDTLDVYGKSLLYLVSNAIEEHTGTPLLGLEEHLKGASLHRAHKVHFAGRGPVSEARTHRGFDADRKTMNHVLETILGKKPKASDGFRDANLTGY